ncbi:MAG: hypothetical protein C5S41_07795, partial [Candidatus Methanomarinus sp.]
MILKEVLITLRFEMYTKKKEIKSGFAGF